MNSKRLAALLIGFLAFGRAAGAAEQFIEDVRISRSGAEATIAVDLACPMRVQSDTVNAAAQLILVRLTPLDACRALATASGFASERTRPSGRGLADLIEVAYESIGIGDSTLTFEFERPVEHRVVQAGSLRSLEITVVPDAVAPQVASPSPLPPAAGPEPERNAAPRQASDIDRQPLRARVRAPDAVADYMINLQSVKDPIGPEAAAGITAAPSEMLYVSQTFVDGVAWYRLRVGFYSSEAEARDRLAVLENQFPRAWIGRAEADELAAAPEHALSAGQAYLADEASAAAVPVAVAGDTAGGDAASVDVDQVESLLSEARNAMIDQRYDAAITIYTRLLQVPGPHRAAAREYLGLARERNGQAAQARAEYQAYLREFSNPADVQRVQQRMNGLALAAAMPRAPMRDAQALDQSKWNVRSGISQYYRRHVNQFDRSLDETVTLSALINDIDFSAQRSGEKINLGSRIAVSHFRDLLNEDSERSATQNRVSYAYLDIDSVARDWILKLGRQSLHRWGVLGRFDGAHFSYDWSEKRSVHYTTGYPVESTRRSSSTDRRFDGVAIEFVDLLGNWDISTYLNRQSIEGVDDRQAIGLEARYLDDKRNVTGMLDYDTHFGQVNMVLLHGTWRFPNRLTLSGVLDRRTSPILTTRNALIGQPVQTIEEMLLVWTVEEVERFAMDRTGTSTTTTLSIAKPVGERFQLSADVTATELEGTIESAGVSAMPGTGQQLYYSASIVGSSLFASADVSVINLRIGQSDSFELGQLTWDARFPVGRRIRLNPRVRFAVWKGLLDGRRRDTVSASFRMLMNLRNRYRLEIELGTDEFERTDSFGTQLSTGSYLNVGYRADF